MHAPEVVTDLGFRGVDADNPGKLIIHRGKFKSLSSQQKVWLKRCIRPEEAEANYCRQLASQAATVAA